MTSRSLIPEHMTLGQVKEQMAWCAALVHAVHAGDLRKIGEAINRDHISEPVRSRYIPGYDELKKRVLAAGALGCNVSGGGSSVFAVSEPGNTRRLAELMRVCLADEAEPPIVLETKSSNRGVFEIHGL